MEGRILELAKSSLRTPRDAAQVILNMGLGRDILWSALALVAIINTFIVTLVVRISGSAMPLPAYFEQPLTLFVLIAGLMVVYIHAMYWAGLAIGGSGTLMDVLSLVVWFQFLRAAAQIAIIVLSLALPSAGLFLSLLVAVWGLWVFLNFLITALNLNTVWHGVAVLGIAFIGLVLGLGALMALIGGIAQGVVS